MKNCSGKFVTSLLTITISGTASSTTDSKDT